MALSLLEAYLGLGLLFLLLLPAGLVLIWCAERWLGRTVRITWVERCLLAFYVAGSLLYALASVPLPLFGTYLVGGVLGAGILGVVLVRVVLGQPLMGKSTRVEAGWELGAIAAGALLLLVFELAPVWQHPLPNAWDGSVAALWVNLTLSNHTLPWTLQPYAAAGVTYPQGETVWMALPASLWGWSVVSTPILVPPLFLTLGLPATYCWGRRLGGVAGRSGQISGLLFAAFFGMVASWPRLYVGGSYDFVMGVPLFLLLLGPLRELVAPPSRPWSEVVLLGVGVGILASLSLTCAEAYAILMIGFVIIDHGHHLRELLAGLSRVVVVVSVAALFIVRSILGTLLWFGYPAHVLTQTGTAVQSPPPFWSPFGSGLLQQELDPFVPWKGRLSPFPAVSLMIQILLVLALLLAAWVAFQPRSRRSRWFPPHFFSTLLTTCAVLFLLTAALTTAQAPGAAFTFLGTISNFDETSYLMFIGLAALALAPLLAAVNYLLEVAAAQSPHGRPASEGAPPPARPSERWHLAGRDPGARRRTWIQVALIVGLVAPFTVGSVATAIEGPSFLQRGVNNWANVTSGDLTVLEWSANHLPDCSAVFVAPGSVGQFLPEYAPIHLVYQMTPSPRNLSYFLSYDNLSSGVYTPTTRLALIELGVTEVFVSGATTPWFRPVDPGPLENSSAFRLLIEDGDASLFEFVGGTASATCAPT